MTDGSALVLAVGTAQPTRLDVRIDDAAKLLHGVGYTKAVQVRALEIAPQPAAHADVVVVLLEVGVEPHSSN